MDKISIVGISATGFHGVYPSERRDGQPFVVDLTLYLDLTAAAASDDLEHTASYEELPALVVWHIEHDPVNLIETLAGRIADDVLTRTSAQGVEVTVHKPRAPIAVPFADISVTIVRSRPAGLVPPREVVFSLGSNLGDRLAHLTAAVAALSQTEGLELQAISGVYETAAVGPVAQPDFLNVVVRGRSGLPSPQLLARGLAVEAGRGRERSVAHGPRTLDVDLLAAGDERLDLDFLTLPHPRAHERAFVLIPWQEVDARAEIPGRAPIADLLAGLDTSGVRPRPDLRIELP